MTKKKNMTFLPCKQDNTSLPVCRWNRIKPCGDVLSSLFSILFIIYRTHLDHDVAIPSWKLRICGHSSYHGTINKEKAEDKLKTQDRNCYLTRYSETRDQLTLSVRRRQGEDWVFKNFDIIINQEKSDTTSYEIFGTREKFFDITELLNFYEGKALDYHIDGIGEELVNDNKRTLSSSEATAQTDILKNKDSKQMLTLYHPTTSPCSILNLPDTTAENIDYVSPLKPSTR